MTQKVLVNSFIQKLLMFINDKKCLGSISKHKKVCSVKWTKSVTEKNIITILNKRYTRPFFQELREVGHIMFE